MRLEPQGLLYAKLTLSEQQEAPDTAEPRVFGLPLPLLVEREQPPGQVPLIIQKCVGQIERRGLRVSPLSHPSGPPDLRATPQDTQCAEARPSPQPCLGPSQLQPQPRQGQEVPSLGPMGHPPI